ncbi:MAG: VOC family protein [Pseudomonadota bacterium]
MRRLLLSLIAATALTGPVNAETPPATPAETSIALQYRGNHVAMRVADLEAAVTWWTDLFGAQEVRRSAVPALDPEIEIAFLHISGGFHIELVGGGSPVDPGAPEDIAADYGTAGYKHVGFLVADLEPVLAHLATHGVTPEYRVTRADYGVEIVLIREPSGRFVELYAPLSTN